jgi:hypothetical protein
MAKEQEQAWDDLDYWSSNPTDGNVVMKRKAFTFSLRCLALLGSLGTWAGSASAQGIYVETYAEPFAVVEPHPVVLAPRYIVRPVVAAPPIVRDRTIIVNRPSYVPLLPPAPPPYVIADW